MQQEQEIPMNPILVLIVIEFQLEEVIYMCRERCAPQSAVHCLPSSPPVTPKT